MKKAELKDRLRDVDEFAEDMATRWKRALEIGQMLMDALSELEKDYYEDVQVALKNAGLAYDDEFLADPHRQSNT